LSLQPEVVQQIINTKKSDQLHVLVKQGTEDDPAFLINAGPDSYSPTPDIYKK